MEWAAGGAAGSRGRAHALVHHRLYQRLVQTLRRTTQRLGHCRNPRLLLADDVGGAHGVQVSAALVQQQSSVLKRGQEWREGEMQWQGQ